MNQSQLDSILLEAATALGGELDAEAVATRLWQAVTSLPGARGMGLGVVDPERELAQRYVFAPAGPGAGVAPDAPEVDETPLADTELTKLQETPRCPLSVDLALAAHGSLHERLRAGGARRGVSWPLLLEDRLVGALTVGFAEAGPLPPALMAFGERLAQVASSVVWSCLTFARFTRGDRRRDALIELAQVINGSLKFDKVLDAVRGVLAGLPGVQVTRVDLLAEDGRTYRSYGYRSTADDAEAPPEMPVAGTVLEHVVRSQHKHQSDDLALHTEFAGDAALRDAGVRRYVMVPMVVHDRPTGGLLIGSAEPQPVRVVDLWVYENVALQLGLAISNALQHEQLAQLSASLAQQNVYLREEIQSTHGAGDMVGDSAVMRRLYQDIAHVAATDATVLITGETGVGKELAARAIHAQSSRADKPLVKINCPAIPESMVESELFGHERGAFTSAVERRIGRFELAHEGTLFLDEIGELSLPVQAKLLRVLQDGEFERVGGARTIVSDARIIAATNRNVEEEVARGHFRSDLFFRLNVFPLRVPALSERREDIPLLIEAFVATLGRRMGKHITEVAPEAVARLQQRDWPGNIRELQHVIERALILGDGPRLEFPAPCLAHTGTPVQVEPAAADAVTTLADMEAAHIRRALAETKGVIEGPRGAARLLGLKPATLRYRMNRLGITRDESTPATRGHS